MAQMTAVQVNGPGQENGDILNFLLPQVVAGGRGGHRSRGTPSRIAQC